MPGLQETRGLPATLMTMRIIAGAMISGVLMFLGVVLVTRNGPPAEMPLLSYLGAGATVAVLVVRMVVPDLVGRSVLHTQLAALAHGPSNDQDRNDQEFPDDGNTTIENPHRVLLAGAAAFQTRMIVEFALLEGVAFFNLVAFMVEGQWWGFASVGVLLACMVLAFPSLGRLETWLQQQTELTE